MQGKHRWKINLEAKRQRAPHQEVRAKKEAVLLGLVARCTPGNEQWVEALAKRQIWKLPFAIL